MSEALKMLETASRRALQALAKELHLCKGNAKSDVIVGHAMKFLDDHPTDGEQMVLAALGSSGNSTPVASPVAKPKEKKSNKKQPDEEPVVTFKSVEVVKTKTPEKKESNTASKETKKVTPKDSKKTKQTVSPAATTKTAATTASPAKSPKSSTKKSPTNKTQPEKKKVAAAKKDEPVVIKKAAPVGKKAEVKARKTVEALVKSMTDLIFVGDSRVRCSTTGHEMKADVDVINAYISGKRYQKARNLKLSFAKYAPMFVDHPDESKTDMLWCNVTESAIVRDEKSVKKHIAAPKYQKQLPIWKEEEAAKKKAEEEEAQRRAARIEAAKKRRLEAAKDDDAESERPAKRKRTAAKSDK